MMTDPEEPQITKRERSRFWRRVTSPIAVVVAGAFISGLGNGVWEIVIRPVWQVLLNTMLDIATFKMRELQDGIYVQVARDPSATLSMIIIFVLMLATFIFPMITFLDIRWHYRVDSDYSPSGKIAALRSKLGLYIGALFLIFMLLFFQLVSAKYVIDAADHLKQLKAIASPYLTIEERLTYDSKSAQISSRDDYIALRNQLMQIAQEHNAKVPKFDPY